MRLLICLAVLSPILLAGCPKELPKRERVEFRRFKVPERPHETAARITAMEKSIEAMTKAMITEAEATCETDNDCTLTNQHCCTCSMGGQRAAVRKDKNLEVAQRRQGLCKRVICNQQVSEHATCGDVQVSCQAGKCVAVPVAAPSSAPEVPTEPIP